MSVAPIWLSQEVRNSWLKQNTLTTMSRYRARAMKDNGSKTEGTNSGLAVTWQSQGYPKAVQWFLLVWLESQPSRPFSQKQSLAKAVAVVIVVWIRANNKIAAWCGGVVPVTTIVASAVGSSGSSSTSIIVVVVVVEVGVGVGGAVVVVVVGSSTSSISHRQ